MYSKKLIYPAVIFFLIAPLVSADVTHNEIEGAVDISKLEHPYLYFSEEDLPAIRNRINNSANRGIFDRLIAEANRLLHTPVDTSPPEIPEDRVYDNTWKYEGYILGNADMAYNLAFTYQITGDTKYALKAFEFIDAVCDVPSWVHGYHEFPIFYDRVWPWGASDDQVVFNYAQWSDHVVLRVAAAYDWLYDALDKRQRDRIRGALLEKAILRVRGNYEYHWWATAYRCNWCTVCNSSLGVASLALLTEDPHLTDVVAESYNRIGKTFDQVRDGGWQEGMSYLYYTVNAALPFADALKRATGGRFNLYKHPRIGDVIDTFLYCYIPPDKTLHFSDCNGRKTGSYNFFNTLMLETGNGKAAWLRKQLAYEQPAGFFDLLKPVSTLEPAAPQGSSRYFRAIDWVVMRSDLTNPENVVVAAKSGKNDDPHHGHLDSGHFSLYWQGQEFISDNGSAVQDKLYFYKERWEYPHASSDCHNVVFVNGEKQLPCKLKNEPWNENIGGKVLEFREGNERVYAILDPSGAYPGVELHNWRRHIILDKPVVTIVLDEISCAKGAEIEVRFHSVASISVGEGYILLKGDNAAMCIIPAVGGDCRLRMGKHAILPVDRNSRFRWIPYVGMVMKAPDEHNIIGTVILPVKNDGEAKSIVRTVSRTAGRDGTVTVSFKKAGEKYSYVFKKGRDGLMLDESKI